MWTSAPATRDLPYPARRGAGELDRFSYRLTAEGDSAGGVTPSERYLAQLCKQSFLSLWSYPNLYTDEGRHSKAGSGKEFCDLMVLFGDHVVLFSDKCIGFGKKGKLDIDWPRWYKRAVIKSVHQLRGAEKWLREKHGGLFLDSRCSKAFPLHLPDPKTAKVHLVAVAVGASHACASVMGGSGSIPISPATEGEAAHLKNPFIFGIFDRAKTFVHIFDEIALDCVLRELDTVSDFTDYLERRAEFLLSGRLGMAAGEDDLLGFYMQNTNGDWNHAFVVPPGGTAIIDEGIFAGLVSSPGYRTKKAADEISYVWDRLIELFAHPIANGTLQFGSQHGPGYGEQSARLLAAEPRLRRRMLSEALIGKLDAVPLGKSSGRAVFSNTHPDIGYVFYVCSPQPSESYEDYRKRRAFLLNAHCMVLKKKWPAVKDVVGISMEPKGSRGGSEDLISLDVRTWTANQESEAGKYQIEFSIFKDENVKLTEDYYDEFPQSPPLAPIAKPDISMPSRAARRVMKRKQRRDRK